MVARDHNYVMPEMVATKTIDIKRGRHPLKELLVNFVPNDTVSGADGSVIKILTGANACGKSIYLKQVALIVFMAHIGSFVPAESATIGIVTHIFTQIHSIDSLAQNASSFLLSLRQVWIFEISKFRENPVFVNFVFLITSLSLKCIINQEN